VFAIGLEVNDLDYCFHVAIPCIVTTFCEWQSRIVRNLMNE